MYLIALLKVLYANGITIREGIDYDSTGEVTDVIFLVSRLMCLKNLCILSFVLSCPVVVAV